MHSGDVYSNQELSNKTARSVVEALYGQLNFVKNSF